ncbi:MAG TPA: sensor histidine kinase KdpD [Gemmatimonadales bacterium]
MAEPRRPDPDVLLAQIQREEPAERARGRLKVFFGATAGVGKTYAMLEEARARKREGVDVVVGVVETHGRKETGALLEGLEIVPRREIEHRGVRLTEFDLDAALARRPGLLLVDELAHTNAAGSRHAKRWQDVEELLGAGIDVFSTVNVQHLESLNDVVARITHVQVRETVPDAVFERADEIELIDLSPEELLQRLAEGKVYVQQQAQRATQYFFRRGNLIALRQLALRKAADRVDAQMQTYRRAHGVAEIWPIAERILVAVGPAPSSTSLVRAAKRMADRLGAEWTAAFVETPDVSHWSEADRNRVWESLRLADQLGGRTVTLTGSDEGRELLNYTRTHNVGRIIVGKPSRSAWRDRLFGSKIERVIRGSGDIDVYVLAGDTVDQAAPPRRVQRLAGPRTRWPAYAWAVAIVGLVTVAAVLLRERLALVNLAMLFLLSILLLAARLGRGPAVLASVLSVAALDWFAVPPYNTFQVADSEYLVTFGVMLAVALTISTLAVRLREQAMRSREREHRTAALYEMSRDLIETTELAEVVDVAVRHVGAVFEIRPVLLLPDVEGRALAWSGESTAGLGAQEQAVAQWVYDHGQPAGAGTDTLPSAKGLYLPLSATTGTVGVFGALEVDTERFRNPEQLHLLETFLNRIAAAIERSRLAEQTRRLLQLEEMDRLKSEFVATASHELRAPLVSLAAALDRLQAMASGATTAAWQSEMAAAREQVDRLRRLADDLLDLARLEAGRVELQRQPVDPSAVIRERLDRFESGAAAQAIRLAADLPDALPLVDIDRERTGRVLDELIGNALRASGPGGRVLVSADTAGRFVQVSVADNGPGISIEDQARIFDKFVWLSGRQPEVSGLGLPIAREVIRAHGGAIWVDSGLGPGSVFSFTVPLATGVESRSAVSQSTDARDET